MSTDIATAAEFHLTDWWDKNKQRIGTAVVAVAVVGLAVSFYFYRKNQNEVNASHALSTIEAGPSATEAYLKVAGDYSGTSAASRALLLAAGNSYAEGKPAEAQGLFERYLREFPESTSRVAALLGVASSLDAQGKSAEAIAKYKDLVQRYANDPAALPAKSALGRLYEAQGQFPEAIIQYQELVRTEQNTSYGLESMVRAQNLLAKHPEAAKALAAGTNAPAKIP